MTLQQIIESSKERDKNVQSGQQSAAEIIQTAGGRFREPVAPGGGGNGPIEKAVFSVGDFDWNSGITNYGKQKAVDRVNGIESRIFDYQSAHDEAMRRESEAAEARRGEIIMSNLAKGSLIAGGLAVGGLAMGGAEAAGNALFGIVDTIPGLASAVTFASELSLPVLFAGGYLASEGVKSFGRNPEMRGYEGSGLDFTGNINFGGSAENQVEYSGTEVRSPISGGGGVSLAGNFGDFWGDIKGAIDRLAIPAARHDDSILFEGMV